ncbi:hypothetical protein HK096_001373, partial [Nowakowskiella sp. JEL0078]
MASQRSHKRPGAAVSNVMSNSYSLKLGANADVPSEIPEITLAAEVSKKDWCPNLCAPCDFVVDRVVDVFLNPDIDDLPVLDAFDNLGNYVKDKCTNVDINPELVLPAVVNTSNEISDAEKKFRSERLQAGRKAFAKFIGVPEHEVDVRDLPVIGAAGSGGGFKAMIATAGSLKGLKESGLYDCLVYLSVTAAKGDPVELIEHFKRILVKHPADPEHLSRILLADVENRVELAFGGLSVKYYDQVPRGIVDAFGAILFAHFMSDHPEKWNITEFKLSNQAKLSEGGKGPMPLYTAVRQEKPWDDKNQGDAEERARDDKVDPWWQWFELSPYEIGSDEIRAFCPTYAFGRRFEEGKAINAVPEQSFGLLVGLIASAMSAPFTTTFETIERSDGKGGFNAWLKQFATKLLRPDSSRWVKRLLSDSLIEGARNHNFMYKLPLAKVTLPSGEEKQ